MVRGIVLAAAAPALILALIESGVLARAALAEHPRWPEMHLNLSEATAVRDTAEVMRLLERGDDPNRRYTVRPGLVDNDREVHATALEAAMSNRRSELVELLLAHGVTLSEADWTRLRCAAKRLGDDDVEAALAAAAGSAAPMPSCTGDEKLW